jgi:hypothetical protein
MTPRLLQVQAYREWNTSADLKSRYHTFDYYWWERYARVYRLPTRVTGIEALVH